MPELPDGLCEIDARVVGICGGVEGGIFGGGGGEGAVAPELVERGVEEDVAVGGIGSEEVEWGVAGTDDGDGTGDNGRAVEVSEIAS